MTRQPRQLQSGYSYHVTTRCNNREFRLTRLECREVFLFAIKKAQQKLARRGINSPSHSESRLKPTETFAKFFSPL